MSISILARKINKNRQYFIINVIGLSLALSSLLLVFSFIRTELSYDKFHSKSDRICRITQNSNTGISSMIDARFFTGSFAGLKTFPQIEEITGLSSFRKAIVIIGEKSFFSNKIYRADTSFFKIFDFELIAGDKNTIFKNPNQAAITESLAKLYFGSDDVLGKEIKIIPQHSDKPQLYKIKAILKDFPANSHIKADILCSYPGKKESFWAYSYILLAKNASMKSLQDSIQKSWDQQFKGTKRRPLVNLQALTNIHLYSHKTREMEINGNISELVLLFTGMLIILIVAFINFINLNYVQFLSNLKNIKIRMINGASKQIIAKEFFFEVLILLSFVIAISLIFINLFEKNLHFSFYFSKNEQILLLLFFSFLIIFLALIPLLYKQNNIKINYTLNNKKIYQLSLFIQLLLSITAIASTLFIQKQMRYTNNLHPKSNDTSIIVIPKNTTEAVVNFEILKEQLLKYPEIIAACGVSEEPGGTVVDNFPYLYNGDTTGLEKTLNVLIVDNDFFPFMGIKPIAGSIDLGIIPSYEWEHKAIKLWSAEDYGTAMPEHPEEITNHEEKYIINKTALKHMGISKPEDAIGKQFRIIHYMRYLFPPGKIIGVVNDFHYTNIHEKEKPLAILPRRIFCHNFLFRIDTNNKDKAIALIKNKWNEINKDIPFKYEFISNSYQKVYKNEYLQMKVIMLFAIISILLSLIGMYAMISFKLKLQTKEIGIRKINGATTFEIIKMLNKDFIKLNIISFIISVPIIYFTMQKWLENFAYKTELSWWIFILSGIFALVLSIITVSWKSFIIARKNPIKALRYE